MKWVLNMLAENAVLGPMRKGFHTDQGHEEERERHEQRMKSRVLGLPKAVQDSETIEGLREKGMVGVYELEKQDVVLNEREMELLIKAQHSDAYKALVKRLGLDARQQQMAVKIIEEVGDRIGVRTMIPCHRCDGKGSVPKWEALKP